MYKAHYFLSLLFLHLFLLQSCVSHQDLVSINGEETPDKLSKAINTVDYQKIKEFKPYTIRPHDQLMLKLNSFEGDTEEYLQQEFENSNSSARSIGYDPSSVYFNSYQVNKDGYIFPPLLEKIKVVGLTAEALKNKLDKAYRPYLKYASTSVKVANMRITVLGEVGDPGVHHLYNEKNTLVDAISLAGDFTDFSNRKAIKLIRVRENGMAESTFINMNKTDFIFTEFYYVYPSDIIYVEPLKAKSRDVSAKTASVVLTAISTAAVLLSLLINGGN